MTNSTIALLFVVFIAAIIASPLISIWAINTLFGLNIPFEFATWFAALWINAIIIANKSK